MDEAVDALPQLTRPLPNNTPSTTRASSFYTIADRAWSQQTCLADLASSVCIIDCSRQ